MAYSNEKEYWAVGYSPDWRQWQVRRRDLNNPTDYIMVEDLGTDIKTAALEFDADFILGEFSPHIQEITEEVPWLFWVTTQGDLYTRKVLANPSSAYLLDTGVEQISACRGFKSSQWDVDQGLVVAYLKTDGTVWHQDRTIDALGQPVWSGAIQILDAGANNTKVQVFRLLDFRTGVYVGGVNKLYISERTYIGNTVKSETVYTNAILPFIVTPFCTNAEGVLGNLEILEVSRYNSSTIQVHANYPIFDYDATWNDITIKQGPAGLAIYYLEWTNGDLFIHLTQDIPTLVSITFACRWDNRKGYRITDNCKPIWPALTFTLQAEPVDLKSEYVAANANITTALQMVEKQTYQVDYTEFVYVGPTITTTLSMIELVYSDITIQSETVATTTTVSTTLSMVQTGVTPI